jgi:hypothetical protein
VIVPTIPGREESLDRCQTAYRERSQGAQLEIITVPKSPCCGVGWLEGASISEGDYIHLSADDLEPHEGWWQPAVATCDDGLIPAPTVYNPDGSVQSAGGDLTAPNCLLTDEAIEDLTPVPYTPVPFVTRDQWERIGMIPAHYMTDVWVSYRGRQLGIETVWRAGYAFMHHNEPVGRNHERISGDREIFFEAFGRLGAVA